jgi:hypothetical protein
MHNESIIRKMLNQIINSIVKNTMQSSIPEPVPSCLQTKDWRKEQPWYKGGKSNECELLQRSQIEHMTGKSCPKTIMRINKRTRQMQELSNPLTRNDGFDWTEDFDGKQELVGKDGSAHDLFYNFKMVCDAGGAQTRSLREVHSFVEAQMQVLLLGNHPNAYFINILDGDQSHSRKEQFNHLVQLPEYSNVREKIFVDDMCAFKDWFQARF